MDLLGAVFTRTTDWFSGVATSWEINVVWLDRDTYTEVHDAATVVLLVTLAFTICEGYLPRPQAQCKTDMYL